MSNDGKSAAGVIDGPQDDHALTATAAAALRGSTRVPGDKSMSHRALMIGALAVGETTIHGLLEGEDVLRTAAAMRALGAEVERGSDGVWRVNGVGVGGLAEPSDVLDLGNSGTGARLLIGLVSTHPIVSMFTGDASLRGRPMARVTTALEPMGAQFLGRSGGRLPLVVRGAMSPVPITYRLPVPSAQVKSAILFAGLNTPGKTTAIEPEPTRDHTELMLRHFGVEVSSVRLDGGARSVTVTGQPEISGKIVRIPADPSSAAFPLVAALLVPGSSVTVEAVGINPHRTGLFDTLIEMGANLTFANRREEAGEPVADITARTSALSGVEVPASRAPSMIDEYPILAMAAACAHGRTVMHGLAELRVKESNRLDAILRGLDAAGVAAAAKADSLSVEGFNGPPPGGATIATNLDHRIAMAFLVLGLAARKSITVDDSSPIDTSFPGFAATMTRLGGIFTRHSG